MNHEPDEADGTSESKPQVMREAAASDTGRNLFIVIGLALALIGAAVVYLIFAGDRVQGELADRETRALEAVEEFEAANPAPTREPRPSPTADPAADGTVVGPMPEPGEVIVVNRVPGDDYGRLAIRHQDGTRTLLDRTCVRVHVANGNGVCVSQQDSLVPAFTTTLFRWNGARHVEVKSYDSALPSRVRVSPDGSRTSVTAFVTGSSYEDVGSGTTTTIVTIDEFEGNRLLIGGNQFEVDSTESRYRNAAAQYWGMTFVDDTDFFVTGFFGDTPEVMSGALDTMLVTPTGLDGSCPSVSPDGKTLVYKALRDDGALELVAVDLATEEQWVLGETRTVDDQVEWLDNDTILYAVHPEGRDGLAQPEWDIWSLDIAAGSEPVLFLPNADSPAVIRR